MLGVGGLDGQQLLADLANLTVAVRWGVACGVACRPADFLEMVQLRALTAAQSVGRTIFVRAAVRTVAVAAAASDARFALGRRLAIRRRVVVPREARAEILERIHSSHIGWEFIHTTSSPHYAQSNGKVKQLSNRPNV